jgi:hypothetical protein
VTLNQQAREVPVQAVHVFIPVPSYQLIPDWLILGLQRVPGTDCTVIQAMMALLRPRLGGGGGGSCDPPAGLEDRFRYRSHGVRAGSARRGAGECSQARRHSAMSDALHQPLPSRRRRGTDCLATKRLETPRTRPSCGAACTRTSFTGRAIEWGQCSPAALKVW